MQHTLKILCYTLAFYHVLPFRIEPKCSKINFLRYYAKESKLYCSRQRNAIKPECYQLPQEEVHEIKTKEMATGSRSYELYRPRSGLARALYEKHNSDRYLEEFDQNEWYKVNQDRLPADVKEKFVQLAADEETKKFLNNSIEKSSWVWTQLWYLLARAVLKYFWSITDINGWLGRGSMFVLSEAQAQRLVSRAGSARGGGALVDLGAGDGEVSKRYAHLFATRYATEISASMRNLLAKKGYKLLDAEEWWQTQQFECVCMMNLLDRCARPRSMLRQARAALAPGGVLLLALVLPYKPYVEVTADHKPEERLPISGACFEEQVASFVALMRQAGFELAAWSRAPYLCEGDFAQAYYWLDDAVFVFTPTGATDDS